MPVIEGGVLKSRRSLWKLSTFSHYFWVVAYLIRAFFLTLFSMESSDAYKANGGYKKWDGGPGGGGHGRGPYGGGPRPRRPRGMSDLQSDHSAPPACGSCCG
ncbi:hypothetical protein ZOSMA_82G00880 [Zostera marina]|uniref:Glycine-rich protein n=1 Tax=Zostera marina TaxID=29655 RepID=A0A0K9NNW9_ZOSMR|nr:hypothetical protein ZOSMA_82G00880 [Zostera marina]